MGPRIQTTSHLTLFAGLLFLFSGIVAVTPHCTQDDPSDSLNATQVSNFFGTLDSWMGKINRDITGNVIKLSLDEMDLNTMFTFKSLTAEDSSVYTYQVNGGFQQSETQFFQIAAGTVTYDPPVFDCTLTLQFNDFSNQIYVIDGVDSPPLNSDSLFYITGEVLYTYQGDLNAYAWTLEGTFFTDGIIQGILDCDFTISYSTNDLKRGFDGTIGSFNLSDLP